MPELAPLSAFETQEHIEPVAPAETRSNRRTFMGRAGIVGLVVAATLFNRTETAAAAVAWFCCSLAYSTRCGNRFCVLSGDYIWRCTTGSGYSCSCCEYHARRCSDGKCCRNGSCVCYGSC